MTDPRLTAEMKVLRRKCRAMEDKRAADLKRGSRAGDPVIRVPAWLMLKLLDEAEAQGAFELDEVQR